MAGSRTSTTLKAIAFKFGLRVHFGLQRKMLKSSIARLPAISLDLINCPSGETDCRDAALTDFNSRQFETRMKKMADQGDSCLLLNAFRTCLQFGA